MKKHCSFEKYIDNFFISNYIFDCCGSLPTSEEFSSIVSTHVTEILKKYTTNVHNKSIVNKLTTFMMDIFDKVLSHHLRFLSITFFYFFQVKIVPPNNRQYLFTTDSVTKWCKNFARYECDQSDFESFLVEVIILK